jgi:hypothetical protein
VPLRSCFSPAAPARVFNPYRTTTQALV